MYDRDRGATPYRTSLGWILRTETIRGHEVKTVARDADVEVGDSGVFVRLRDDAETFTHWGRCSAVGCKMPSCSSAQEPQLNRAVTRVLKATGNYVLEVTVPRLAESADELYLAVEAVKRAAYYLMGDCPKTDVYGVFAVAEWHREGVTRERALQAVAARDRSKFPLHIHAVAPIQIEGDLSRVVEIEKCANERLREFLNADIYHGKLGKLGQVEDDLKAIKAGTKSASVPYVRLVPTAQLGSTVYKAGYLLKHMAPDSPYNLRNAEAKGLSPAAMIARHHEVNALMPGQAKLYYAYRFPKEGTPKGGFFSLGAGWTKAGLIADTNRREWHGWLDADKRDWWDSAVGRLVTVTHKGEALHCVVSANDLDRYPVETARRAVALCVSEAEAALMVECERKAHRRVLAHRADCMAHKALYASLRLASGLSARLGIEAQMSALRARLASLSTRKAAPGVLGLRKRLDVQSTAHYPRPPPLKSAARLLIRLLSIVRDE